MNRPRNHAESGFTLLELLLVVGVSAIMLIGISQLTRSWVDAEVSEGAGQQLQRASVIVQKYIAGNWIGLTVSTPDVLADAANPGSVWANLQTALDQEGLLTGGVLRSPLGVTLQISYVYDLTSGTPVYRASIFSATNLPNKKVIDTARQAGTVGGTVTTFPDANQAVGAFGQWSVPKGQLISTGVFPCATTATRGCLVAMVSYNNDMLCGSFLYRTDVETSAVCPGGNTMNTALNMNNNALTNASNIQTQDLDVSNDATLGTTTVSGPATFGGPTSMSQGITINNGMNVTGDANFSGNVTMEDGTLNVTDLNASTVRSPQVSANDLTANNMTMNNAGGSLTVDGDMTVNGNLAVGSGGGGQIYVDTVNANQIDTGTGGIVTGTMEVQNSMQITGVVDVAGGTLAIDRLVADKCVLVDDGTGTNTFKKYGGCP